MSKNEFLEIKNLLAFVWDNQFSDFYRKKYQAAGFDQKKLLNPENFTKLPFLTRQELESTPPDERLFIGPDEVQFVAYTSGTTNQKPLIIYFSKIDNYYFDPTLNSGVKRLLIVHPPLNKHFGHTFVQQCVQSKNKSFPVFGDYQNLANSAVIASQVKIDGIYATPTIALFLAKFIEKYYEPKEIKLLVLGSETLTSARREKLEALYPNAKIANAYTSAEIGQYIFYPCLKIINEKKNWFHVLQPPVLKTELINGELVITYANNKALPLIRYQTGDFFELVDERCPCGIVGPVFAWTGREGVDKIKVSGVEIKVDDVEKIFSQLAYLVGDFYQLHFYENHEGKIKIVVEIIENKIPTKIFPPENIAAVILNHLMNNWDLSPSSKLKDVVAKNLFAVPEIKFIKDFSYKSAKIRRLVNHLNEK